MGGSSEERAAERIAKPASRPRKPAAAPLPAYRLDEQVGFLMRRAQQRHIAIFQRIMGDDGADADAIRGPCRNSRAAKRFRRISWAA